MNILIQGKGSAESFFPVDPTYAIRIQMSGIQPDSSLAYKPLTTSPNWVGEHTYIFDDVWLGMGGGYNPERDILFSSEMAREIIMNFQSVRERTQTLLVHCSRGINRSPAVAIALATLFGLKTK